MKARDKNIELVATLKTPSLLIIGVANSEANQSIKESYAVTAKNISVTAIHILAFAIHVAL